MYMIPYTCQKSTVSSILGQQQQLTIAESRPTLPKCVGWPTVAGTSQMEAQMGNQQKTEELAARLCDREKTRTYQKFQGAFWGLMKCIKEFKSVWYMSSMFTDILTRCLTETRFWPVKEITELMQLYNMPASVMPKLVDALIQHGEISLLHNFLQKVTDVPEVCLCKALQYYITAEDEELAKAAETIFIESLLPDTSSDEKQPFGVHKAYFVNSMLKEGFNDVFLVDYLKSLNFKNVLVLLEHLRHMLGNRLEDIEIEEEDMDDEILFLKKDGEKKRRGLLFGQPTIGQIADWISVTLDAHITQLIISPDARLTLINLHTCVASQVQFYDELSGLEALLDQLKAKCSVTSKQAVGQYCVEVLHIH